MKITALLVACLLLDGADAAGNEEKLLDENVGVTSQDTEERVSYQCTFRNLWTKERQPKNYPTQTAQWGGPIMWTHTLQFEPWRAGDDVTRGVEKIAEWGFTDVLIEEMEQQGEQVLDWSTIKNTHPDEFMNVLKDDYVHFPPLETNKQFPYISVMAGMRPSPDWYTGFYSFWAIDEYSRTFYDHIHIQTYPWDAGTDAGTTYDSLDSDLDPALDIERFVPRTAKEIAPKGELRSPDGETVPVVAEWECFLVVGDENIEMPDCDWFANPCCNETDKENCGAVLPNGATPKMSEEYAQVLAGTGSHGGGSGAMQQFSWTVLVAGLALVQWILV